METQTKGLLLGLIAVACFGLTLPISHYVLQVFDPLFIGVGRTALAGCVAAGLLYWQRAPLPTKAQFSALNKVVVGVVLGFPLFSSWAMQTLPGQHGGVVIGLLPLLTALIGAWLAQEKPSLAFWLTAIVGACLVLLYINPFASGLQVADGLLLLAALSAAMGYAYGGQLAKTMPSGHVICWALVVALPLTLPLFMWVALTTPVITDTGHWLGFLYLALISQLFGFFLWYRGLALGGIARVSQVQLLQPIFTLLFAWSLGESVESRSVLFVILVVITVFFSKKMPITQRTLHHV